MGALSPTHWLIIIGIVAVLFGAKKLPDAARGIGRSTRILQAELRGLHDDHQPPTGDPPQAPVIPNSLAASGHTQHTPIAASTTDLNAGNGAAVARTPVANSSAAIAADTPAPPPSS